MILHVLEENSPAKGLYESLGFERFERIVHLKRENPTQMEKRPLPSGYRLLRIGLFDRRALEVTHASHEEESAKVYGEPQLPPLYFRLLARFLLGIRERCALVHGGRWVGIYTFEAELKEKGAATAAISLLREHRSQGVEPALLSHALGRAAEVGSPRLIIHVNEQNLLLLKACEELGLAKFDVMEGMFMPLESGTL